MNSNTEQSVTIEPEYSMAKGPNDDALLALGEELAAGEIAARTAQHAAGAAADEALADQALDPANITPTDKSGTPAPDPTKTKADDTPITELGIKPKTGEKPAWLPEKFKSPEDLAKAYSELEAKQSGKKSGTLITSEELSSYSEEYSKAGALSAESYTKLEGKGIPKELVDSYIEGQRSRASAAISTTLEAVGGADKYKAATAWAAETLSAAEVATYNRLVNSPDPDIVRLAVSGLVARHASAAPAPAAKAPSIPARQNVADQGGLKPFSSQREFNDAVAHPAYKVNPAYRKMVENRLRVSTI